MKISLFLSVIIFIFFVGFNSCQKGIASLAAGTQPSVPVDSTITDTTQFVDFTLNGKRIFEISSTTAESNSKWKWYPLMAFWGFAFPDTVHYQYSSLKGGLGDNDNLFVPGFYFLKNIYALNLQTYAASKQWWTPLLLKSFIDSFFQAGNYNYAVSTLKDTTFMPAQLSASITRNLLSSGIQLTWMDETGKIWQTSNSTADQANSFFTITENVSTPFTLQPGYSDYAQSTLVTANFQCNLYDGAGNVIHLTNGRFRLMLNFEQDEY